MDAVRAKNLSCYGYERKTTPFLEDIVRDSVLYLNSISSSYWTLPSYASMFTGTYLSKHGLVVDGDLLNENFVTLAELLRLKGYFTAGFCRNEYVSSFSGLDRGFKAFYDFRAIEPMLYKLYMRLFRTRVSKESETIEKNTLRISSELQELGIFKRLFWLLTSKSDKCAKAINDKVYNFILEKRKPFFIFIHYDEAHLPYIAPKPFREKYLTAELKRETWNVNQNYLKFLLNEVEMDEKDFEILTALYNGSINYLDKRIHEVFNFLEKEGLLGDTMIIITSDHGDNIGEKGLMFHLWCLYDTLVKVPLIIKYPEEIALYGKESKVVQNVDLLPTIMDILNVNEEKLHSQIQGNSLLSEKIRNRNPEYAISELMKPFGHPVLRKYRNRFRKYDRRLICIRTMDRKYILSSNGKDEFYDLVKDPEEHENLINSGDPIIPKLKRELKPWLIAFNKTYENNKEKIDGAKKLEFSVEIRERLRKLGYL